ncbi:hypothetical protein EHQ49_06910 [Leptospira perdikensis]|uniref:Outer membrane protein beta-barrel domain-containing protein n=2 Tax=Leptospira perdikensis TaxID=2484948 RepID=A0A4R9JKZ8_9LEPT|nr:hypothetical protein EHQ49_06910 [Leptospira perdikensis]
MRKVFKHSSQVTSIFVIFFCLLSTTIFSQTQKPEAVYGFYKGGFYMSTLGGETAYIGGSLIQREQAYQNGLRTQATLGVMPVRMIGVLPFPQNFPLPNDKVQAGNTRRATMEYGLTEHIGLFISYSTMSVVAQGNNQLAYPDRNSPNGYTNYVEAVPLTNTLYKDRNYGLGLNYHFLSRNKFDPFIGLEVSILNFDAKYRTGQLNNLYYPTYTHPGTGIGGRVALGMNYYVTPEFGFSLELFGSRKILKSNAFSSEAINHAGFQFGFIFNLDAIGKY